MKKITSTFLILAVVLFSTGSLLFMPKTVTAANLTVLSDTMTNENASGSSSQVIKFTAATTMTAGQTIIVAWPSGFNNTGAVFGDVLITHGPSTGLEYGTGAGETVAGSNGSATVWGAAFTDGACTTNYKCTLTLTAPSGSWTNPILATHKVIITFAATHQLNPAATGSKTISLTTSSDSGSVAVPIITNDQVTIDATVAPVITFTNDQPALHFGTLSSSAATWANTSTGSATDVTGNTFAISTNATSGYTLTYAAAATLTSGSNTIATSTITNDADGTPGSGQFAMSAVYTNGSGGGTLTSAYNHATGSGNWKFNTAGDSFISTTGPVNADSVAMHYLANISNVTPAGTYTQTNTWIATGNF